MYVAASEVTFRWIKGRAVTSSLIHQVFEYNFRTILARLVAREMNAFATSAMW